jgi:AraC family transcriptional regulator, regulatory protein of adaptative response / methylphosphotriester-DNA alkyltransferase methyltransferase
MSVRSRTLQTRRTLLDEALAVIEADYGSDLSLDDVARRIATSRRQLQRCFAEHGEASFRACLTRVRMDRAAELLLATPRPVREVAAAVGYRQPAQFAKAFRRRHGLPPAEFRAQRRGAGTGLLAA